MLAKKYRLPVQSMIGKRGGEVRFTHFLLKFFPSALKYARFGVILKKGIAKKASDRNRVRRVIFDVVRKLNAPELLPNRDIIIIVGRSAIHLKSADLNHEMQAVIGGIMSHK